MGEQESVRGVTATQPNAAPNGYKTWNDYWTKTHNLPWRTEPEISQDL